MAHYQDFTVCDYLSKPWEKWLCRLMAIGWIEHGYPFDKGPVDAAVVEKLRALRAGFADAFPERRCRGLHDCSICERVDRAHARLEGSHVNLFIPHRGFVFLAPGRIDHHIEAHGYRPPESFSDAVMACPSPSSDKFRELLRLSNRGVDAPLYG